MQLPVPDPAAHLPCFAQDRHHQPYTAMLTPPSEKEAVMPPEPARKTQNISRAGTSGPPVIEWLSQRLAKRSFFGWLAWRALETHSATKRRLWRPSPIVFLTPAGFWRTNRNYEFHSILKAERDATSPLLNIQLSSPAVLVLCHPSLTLPLDYCGGAEDELFLALCAHPSRVLTTKSLSLYANYLELSSEYSLNASRPRCECPEQVKHNLLPISN
jgi:hypothetical protein